MPTAADVADLRRDGDALLAAGAENVLAPLQTQAAVIGYLATSLRAEGHNEHQVVDAVELVVVATAMSREEIREVRTTLQKLRYPTSLTQKLTKLARRARQAAAQAKTSLAAKDVDLPYDLPKVDETALALKLLRPRRR